MDAIFITAKIKSIRTIKHGDPMFKIPGSIVMSDRASLEITPKCPEYYSRVIIEAYSKGWIKPAAHFTEREYILLGLANN